MSRLLPFDFYVTGYILILTFYSAQFHFCALDLSSRIGHQPRISASIPAIPSLCSPHSVYWVFPSIVFVLAEQPGGLFHRGSSIFILRTVSCLQSPQSKAFFSSFSSGFVLLSFHFPCVEFSIRSLMFTLSRLFGYNFFSCFFSLFLSLFFFVFENRWRDPISSTEIDVSFPKFISTEA